MIKLRNRETWDTCRRYIYKGIFFEYDSEAGQYVTWLEDGAHSARTLAAMRQLIQEVIA